MKSSKLFGSTFLWLLASTLLILNANAQDSIERGQFVLSEAEFGELNEFVLRQLSTGATIGSHCGSEMFTDNIEPIRLDFYEGARFKLTDVAGTIRISSWAENENENTILIEAKKKVSFSTCPSPSESPEFFLDQLDVEVFGDANELTVSSIFPEFTPSGVSLSLDYDIKIPNRASLDIVNIAGEIIIRGVAGSMDLDLEAGIIDVLHPAYPEPADVIDLRVTSGSVILALPTESTFDIDASVDVGIINVEEPLVTVNPTLVGANVDDSVNGGGTDVIIRVVSGAIKLTGL